jgi:hypothetical protein
MENSAGIGPSDSTSTITKLIHNNLQRERIIQFPRISRKSILANPPIDSATVVSDLESFALNGFDQVRPA